MYISSEKRYVNIIMLVKKLKILKCWPKRQSNIVIFNANFSSLCTCLEMNSTSINFVQKNINVAFIFVSDMCNSMLQVKSQLSANRKIMYWFKKNSKIDYSKNVFANKLLVFSTKILKHTKYFYNLILQNLLIYLFVEKTRSIMACFSFWVHLLLWEIQLPHNF